MWADEPVEVVQTAMELMAQARSGGGGEKNPRFDRQGRQMSG